MPLLDHFHPPLSRTHPWRSFHGTWAACMARLLNADVLPVGYYAMPFLDREGPFEIDVATLREAASEEAQAESDGSQPWSPTAPGQAIAVEWPSTDEVRVEIFADEGDPRLAAIIEWVSPRNKDRPSARKTFAGMCAEHLRRGCGVVVVDPVTTRHADLHVELLRSLKVDHQGESGSFLSAVAYRAVEHDGKGQLQIWYSELELRRALPTLPLWLGADLAVPLDLETSHTAACADLRIREAS